MKYEEKINYNRLVSIVVICLSSILSLGIMCGVKQLYPDEWICLFLVEAIFLAVFIFELEQERVQGNIFGHTETDFMRPCIGFLCSCVVGLLGMFFPEYFKPVVFIAMIMYAFSNEMIAISCGLYFSVLACLFEGRQMNELINYVFLVLVATVFFKAFPQKGKRFYVSLLYFCFQLLIPSIFYYWNYKIISYEVYIWGLGMGAAAFLFTLFGMGHIRTKVKEESNEKYQELLSDNYVEVREVKAFSMKEYDHAKKVSKLAGMCAKECNLRVELCQAAGFYYRMGKRMGEPFVENGVMQAKKLCFPREVQQILAEYNGEEQTISTPESAIVHMVDGLLVKLDVLEKDMGGSIWNLEILISQTLNEFSASGLYDASGLSMNQFLKAREILSREVTR